MKDFPNLAGVATKDLVETKGGGSFSASYINWARTMNLLHTHAPGWMVSADQAPDGGIVFPASNGGYLMLRLAHIEGQVTPAVPQAIMDNRNNSIPVDKITSRDVTDTHRRGACMVLAMHFGLGYELWAKDELESGYQGSAPIGADVPHITKSERIAVDLKKPEDDNATPNPDRPVGNVFEAIDRVNKYKTFTRAKQEQDKLLMEYRFTQKDRDGIEKAVQNKRKNTPG